MTVKEFTAQKRQELSILDRFEAYWSERMKQSPQNFPGELQAGDWDEQFRSFCELIAEIQQ